MNTIHVAFVWDDELKLYTAYIPNVGAYGEGATKQEALTDLKEAVSLFVEAEGWEAFVSRIEPVADSYEPVSLQTFA